MMTGKHTVYACTCCFAGKTKHRNQASHAVCKPDRDISK